MAEKELTPVLPIRNTVLFPSISLPLIVGRNRSLLALDQAVHHGGNILIVTQKTHTEEDPAPEDLYSIGTLCRIEAGPGAIEHGSRQVVVTGLSRFKITSLTRESTGYLAATGEIIPDQHAPDAIRNEAFFYQLKELSREILELLPGATDPMVRMIDRVEDPAYLTYICAAYLNLSVEQKQDLLEMSNVEDRIEILLKHMRREREVLSIQREIRDKMAERLSKAQREGLLREQIRTIRSELGEEEAEEQAADDISARIERAHLPDEAAKQAKDELARLRALPSNSAEYHVIRTYLEWMVALPWDVRSESHLNVKRARQILDEDHYGLDQVKRRIVQFLAVAQLKNNLHGPILCLIGPPGVGKTSLGQSIARALDRKFVRVSLGGVRDEAEIRGHRRTYVGAMPGRIVQSIKRAGTKNPVMMLDEIDKLYADFHGDPSAAMLEVLDPEQNKTFVDHYLDVAFDLSEVLFIATGNMIDNVPPALRDRMEVIEVNGYTTFEKLQIARRYLLPKLAIEHGFEPGWLAIPDETIETVIDRYTREAGIRELQRRLATLYRTAAEQIVEGRETQHEVTPITVTRDQLQQRLGPERFFPEPVHAIHKPGIAIGLAWTAHGGDLLYIEVTGLPKGRGHLVLTGQLGDVMKESAQIALSLARSAVGTRTFDFRHHDLHIHVPAGAIPKDGPSAGVTILSALASLLVNRPIEPSLAMTGEITLRGAVLPVGGIKEKVLAAHRAGIKRIVLPSRNRPDLNEIPEEVRNALQFLLVDTVEEVLDYALTPFWRSPAIWRPSAA